MASSRAESAAAESEAFAKHAQEDQALKPSAEGSEAESSSPGLSMFGRIMVFLAFPTTMGTIGLYMGYLESIRKPERKISFDQDFVVPFLLALAMSAVLFFQTGGFSTSKVKPLVSWPKVRRVKKVVKKKKSEIAEDKVDYTSSAGTKKNN